MTNRIRRILAASLTSLLVAGVGNVAAAGSQGSPAGSPLAIAAENARAERAARRAATESGSSAVVPPAPQAPAASAGPTEASALPAPAAQASPEKTPDSAAQRAARRKAAREEAARLAAEKSAKAAEPASSTSQAAAAAPVEKSTAPDAQKDDQKKAAAEKAAKLKADQEEAAAKAKAERAARLEAKRVADEEAARVAAEKAAKLKADQEEAAAKAKAERAARLEAKRLADEEAARVASEKAAKLKAERAAAAEAKRLADEEAARAAAEKAAKMKAERAAAVEAKRLADEEAARVASERAEKLKAERAAAAEKAKADRAARAEALAQQKAEAAERLRAQRAARAEADRVAKEAAQRQAAQAAKEQQAREQAALVAYSEAAAPEDLGSVTAVLGSGLMLNWPEASKRIAIADESIATFHVVSPREVAVYGVKPGRTTIFVWLSGGRRLFYRLLVEHNLEPARNALREMNPSLILESGADGDSVVLRGEVASEVAARQAKSLVEQLLPTKGTTGRETLRLVNLVRYAGVVGTPEDRLAVAMAAIDPRIKVRRIQSTAEPDAAKDSYILEGTVRDVNALVQAVVLADRQLGGNGKTVRAADDDRVTFERTQGAGAMVSGSGTGSGANANALRALQEGAPPKSGISAQIARGLLVTSESGRVVSFLKVENLPQIMVSIRVLEVDRNKARRMGLDVRGDRKNFSAANYTIPNGGALPDVRGKVAELANTGNVVATYVDKTLAVVAAMDFMTEKQVARSVAEPNILTLSGEQASVLVGGEVPIPTTTTNQVAISSGFFFQQFGVRLDLRPTVDSNGLVTLEVAPSIVRPSAGLGNGNVPGFNIQRVETTARVQAGESLVLGGLLSSTESVQERGIPLLGKLPLFRWQRKSLENTELLFLITPKIITPPTEPVRLPALDFKKEPTNPVGLSGLDANGVPFSFQPQDAKIAGEGGSCVEVRERPDNDSQLMDCLVPKTEVLILEGKGRWRRIQVPKGVEGWLRVEGIEMTPSKPTP